jgi:hypothetical protein
MIRQTIGSAFFARTAAILWISVLFSVASGAARAADIFTVTGISIDATADNATAARDAAVRSGEKRALETLLKRLTLQSDWGLLPQIDEITAESMVRAFQVAGEKRSATRYLAALTVSFQPAAVRSLLTARSIPFSESPSRRAVLVAVLTDETGDKLWDEGNAWTAAWALNDLENTLTPMVMPLGDIGDMTTLTVQQALSGDRVALQAMAERYSADRVIVAHAQSGETPDSLSARFVTYPIGEAAPRSWAAREGGSGSLGTSAYRLAARFVDKSEADWKRDSISRSSERAVLSASVAYQSLTEWQGIRRRLDQIPLIQNVTIVAVSTEGAQVELDYIGGIDTLDLNMAQQNLALTDLDGFWYLAAVR